MLLLFIPIIVGFATALWTLSVVPFLPVVLQAEPVFVIATLLLVTNKRRAAFVATAVCGLIISAYPMGTPPFLFLRWMAAVGLADFLLRRVLTNRSLYASVALVLAARCTDVLLGWMASGVTGWFSAAERIASYRATSWMVIFWDVILVAAFFLLFLRGRHGRIQTFRATGFAHRDL